MEETGVYLDDSTDLRKLIWLSDKAQSQIQKRNQKIMSDLRKTRR
jgi:hypothetical protein